MLTMPTTDNQGDCGVAMLLRLGFGSGDLRLTSWPASITSGGNTYQALGSLLQIDGLSHVADTGTEQLTISLAASQDMLAATLGNVENYRGHTMALYLQLMSHATLAPVGTPVLIWSGYMDTISTDDRVDAEGLGLTSVIKLTCAKAGLARSRNRDGLRMTNEQQQAQYPGDTFFSYVRSLIEQPSVWLTKRFQEQ